MKTREQRIDEIGVELADSLAETYEVGKGYADASDMRDAAIARIYELEARLEHATVVAEEYWARVFHLQRQVEWLKEALENARERLKEKE